MTFVTGLLLGSMLGACVGFLTAGAMRAVRPSNDAGETAHGKRLHLRGLGGDAPIHIADGVRLAPWPVEPV